jgi:ABC-2 type transport system ATP-binding protein
MVTSAVSAVGLTKVYGGVRAVDGVSFDVEAGEVFSLLGPNGAGKTTTVEMLECLRTPTSGDAYIMGYSIRNRSEVGKIKKIIGVLPQEFHAVDNLTVYENVLLAAAAKKNDAGLREILEGLGLWDVRDRRFSKLSGGMKRKVGIAMALVGEPEVVFLDEPTTGLDPEARRETWRYLLAMKKEGRAILLTTHYMEEAERLSDRVAIMVKGRIAAIGKTRELVSRGGRVLKVSLEGINESLAAQLRATGYAVNFSSNDRAVINLTSREELLQLLTTLEVMGFRGVYEVRSAGLEEVFLATVGSKLTETGDLA